MWSDDVANGMVMWQVRHPGVATRIHQDFQIMGWVADVAQRVPALKWLNLRQSVDQFSHTMTAQVKTTEPFLLVGPTVLTSAEEGVFRQTCEWRRGTFSDFEATSGNFPLP